MTPQRRPSGRCRGFGLRSPLMANLSGQGDQGMKTVDRVRCFLTMLSIAAAVTLAGCSPGDVAFEGKIFDAMGMNSSSKREAPKLAARSPLVVPPDLERLPDPNAPSQSADDTLAFINDPDRAQVIDQAQLEKRQQEYCAKHYDPAVAMGSADADSVTGPMGPCRKSILTSIKALNGE